MGQIISTPEGDIYIPDEGETNWTAQMYGTLTTLGSGSLGGGGGNGNLIDVTESPFSADPTGDAFADSAIQAAADAMLTTGSGSGLWLPGVFKVKSNLLHLEADAGGYTIAMPRGGKLLLGDDTGGDSLFSCLGRHGFADGDVSPNVDWVNITVDGNSRLYSGDAWADFWQLQDHTWTGCNVVDLKGSAWSLTGARRPSLRTCRVINSGAGETGSAAIDWHHSDEGGTIGRRTESGSMDDVWVIGSDDFAVLWTLTYACTMTNSRLTHRGSEFLYSSGESRPAFFGVDMEFCQIIANTILNARQDCMRLQSRGVATAGIDGTFSHDNIVAQLVALGENGGVGGGGFYGVREFAPYPGVSHAGNLIDEATIAGTVQRD